MGQTIFFPQNKRLITAEILYHLPDYPEILQTFLWQDEDETPEFPTLRQFLSYWQQHLEGKIHSVSVASVNQFHGRGFMPYEAEFPIGY
jgi:uncharacterized protein Usg